jgi:hypothetical protein
MQVVDPSNPGIGNSASAKWFDFFHADVPKSLVLGYVTFLTLAYVVVVTHTPLAVIPVAPHDDGLFMKLGQHLAEGRWLGRYDQFTLIKGPGYPGFLAVSQWLGFPASLAHALFHCFAVTVFVVTLHRFIGSFLLSGFLFALLLWHPVLLSLQRVLREQIYSGQVLLILAAFTAILFIPLGNFRKMLFSSLCGILLGWFWLTREEGIWIVPGILILVSVAMWKAFQARKLRSLFASLMIISCVFAATQVSVRAINLWAYGKFIDVEVKEKNFLRALRAIDSVRSGGTKPYISVTMAARQRIYAVSQAFASLRDYFDAQQLSWAQYTCQLLPDACGEIGAGWFLWALRDVAELKGHLASPTTASAFFKQLANEISSACDRKELECSPQLIPELPQTSWADLVKRVPSSYLAAANTLSLIHLPLQFNPSSGTEAQLLTALRFLNYPMYSRPDGGVATTYRLSGWYYRSGHDWFWIHVKNADGTPAAAQMSRLLSPDIQAGSKDAVEQRFVLETRCVEQCVVQFETPDGSKAEKTLGEIRLGLNHFLVGSGTVHVDSMQLAADPFALTRLDRLCIKIREVVLSHYFWFSIPTLVAGAFSFLAATALYWRLALSNVNYLMALVCWLPAFFRTSLLVLIDATSFPALSMPYLSPTYFLLIGGAVLSCAALLNLASPGANLRPWRSDGMT